MINALIQTKSGPSYIFTLVYLGVVALLLVAGVSAQLVLPLFSSRLQRVRRDSNNIINFAYAFGNRAQRHLTTHFQAQREMAVFSNESI